MDILEQVLTQIGIAEAPRAVYMDLALHGTSSARQISVRLSMTRPSVYDQIKILLKKGLVAERDMDGKAMFAIHDIADLGRLMEEDRARLDALTTDFDAAKKKLQAKTESVEPKIKFIGGCDAVLLAMHDMLWDDSVTLKAVWPYQEMIRVLGKKSLVEFNRKRIRNDLRLQTIWPGGKKVGDDFIWKDGDDLVERRIAPETFRPRMAYTIYGDKVLFISSAAESFGFVVQSRDFAHLMTEQFEVLWSISKKQK